jgi:hypothetical protein
MELRFLIAYLKDGKTVIETSLVVPVGAQVMAYWVEHEVPSEQ